MKRLGYRIVPLAAAPFPDISYRDQEWRAHALKQNLGKLTVVHFWATWCPPCIDELPGLNAAHARYAQRGLRVIAISEDSPQAVGDVRAFLQRHRIDFLAPYFDQERRALMATQARGLPTSFFLDGDGDSIGIAEGPVDWESQETRGFIESRLR